MAISEWIMGPRPHQTLLVLIHTKPGSVNDAQSAIWVSAAAVQVGWAGAAVRETSGRTGSVLDRKGVMALGLHCPISQSTVKARSVFNEDVKGDLRVL